MKTVFLFLLAMMMLFPGIAIPQDVPVSVTDVSGDEPQIFSRGTWRYNLNQALGGKFASLKSEGDNYGNITQGDINIGADYFVADNIGVGANIYRDGNRIRYESGNTNKYGTFGLVFRALYGKSIGDFNLLGKVFVGFGFYKDKYESDNAGEDYEYKENLFEAGFSVGSPFRIDNNFYITPEIGYRFHSARSDDWKDHQNGIFIGVNLDLFFDCDDFFCDIGNDFQDPANRYEQGNLVFGSRTGFHLNAGGCKETYTGEDGDQEAKYGFSDTRLSANVYYYVIDNLAVGGGIGFNASTDKGKDNDYVDNSFQIDFLPMVMFNMPTDNPLKNLFLDAGIGFGTEKYKEGYGDPEEYKFSRFSYTFGLGYNFFITGKSCLVPYLGYAGVNRKNKDSDTRYNTSGAILGIGWYVHLPVD